MRQVARMKPDCYKIMSLAVEEGVRLGLNRAEKHGEIHEVTSSLTDRITSAVMLCVCEYFTFDDQNAHD